MNLHQRGRPEFASQEGSQFHTARKSAPASRLCKQYFSIFALVLFSLVFLLVCLRRQTDHTKYDCVGLVDVVRKEYLHILRREPDLSGLKEYLRALSQGELTVLSFRKILLESDEASLMKSSWNQNDLNGLALAKESVKSSYTESNRGPAMYLVTTITDPPFKILAIGEEEDRVVSGELLQHKFYTADVTNLLYTLFRGMSSTDKSRFVVVDAGSNIGYYTLMSLASFFEVVAFEPQVRACQLLRMSVTVNGFQGLTLVNAALSDTVGATVRVPYVKGNWGGSSTIDDTDVKICQTSDMECASTTTVDANVQKTVFVLKIDVEGHEEAVLRGSMDTIRRFRPMHIIMEYRPEQMSLADWLLSIGYVAFNIREWDFFGQNGKQVFNTTFAPQGVIELSLATKLDQGNIIEFTHALASRSCEIGCFTDLYFQSISN
jgi:FkbM family methyltransferase